MAGNLTRIKNNQVTDAAAGNTQVGINAGVKLQNYSITATKIANNLTYGSDLTITGNLTVQGTTTNVDTVNTLIQDPLITLADGQTSGTPTLDIGTIGLRGSQNSAILAWKESQKEFVTALSNTTVSNTTFNISSYANLHTGNMTVEGTTSLVGNVASLNVTGNIAGGNLLTNGLISATGNITGGSNLIISGYETVTGNITGGNVLTGGVVSATGNIRGANINTDGLMTATGNITGGNILTGGLISSTGNISTGANLIVSGYETVTGNITGGNILTGGLVNATGSLITGANLTVAGVATVTGNISTGANLLVSGYESVTGNITGGNVLTSGIVSATGNIVNTGNLISNGIVYFNNTTNSANANATGAVQILGGGSVSKDWYVAGNIYAGNIIAIQANTLSVQDPLLYLTANAPYPYNYDIGFYSQFQLLPGNPTLANGYQHTGWVRKYTDNVWYLFSNVNTEPGTTVTFDANTVWDTMQSGSHNIVGYASATGNITGGNLITGGLATVTGNITGGNILTGGVVSAVGNLRTDSNVIVNGYETVAGNITGGNVLTGGLVSAVGNVNGGNLIAVVLVQGQTVSATANVIGGNITTAGLMTATGNITGGNILTGGLISATSNITGGNLISVGYVQSANGLESTSTYPGPYTDGIVVDYTTGNGRISTGSADGLIIYNGGVGSTALLTISNVGALTLNGTATNATFTTPGNANIGNTFWVNQATGSASFGNSTQITNAIAAFNVTTSIKVPVGATAQRPGVGVTGMMRFNSDNNNLEIFDNAVWTAVGVPVFTVIADEQFNGDGTTVAFTLGSSQTTSSCIVSINGIVQIPTTAYSVSGTTLTFTEAPAAGDLIDVREITTTTTVTSITNTGGNAKVVANSTSADVVITGNLSPVSNVTQSLGNVTNQWKSLYVSGNTIYLGGLQLSTSGNTLNVYTSDGSNLANLGASGLSVTSISDGTSAYQFSGVNGNAIITSAGSNVLTVSSTGTVTSGTASVSGNITGGNILTGAQISAAGTITGGNVNTGGNISAGGNVLVAGYMSVAGNLYVANVVSSANLVADDPLVYFSSSYTYPYNYDIGFYSHFTGGAGNTYQHTGLIRDYTDNTWKAASNIPEPGGLTLDLTNAVYDPFKMGVLTVNAQGNATAIINGAANAVGNIGSSTGWFNTVYATSSKALYADLAENYTADAKYAPGTVLVFGGTAEVTVNAVDGDRRVAGVVSTNPSYVMNAGLEGELVATVALTGRVPTMVLGPVKKGDMLVAAGLGRARAEADPKVGTVIGKALEDFDGAEGTIEVVVGRY